MLTVAPLAALAAYAIGCPLGLAAGCYGGKVDAVPGYTTYTWFKAPHAGSIYTGHCAQLCGRQHAAMLARVKIVTPAQYQQWITNQSSMITSANSQVNQLRQVLTANGNL